MTFRTKNIQLSAIKQMELRASRIPGVVSLAQGIPSFDTPEVIRRQAAEALQAGLVAKYSLSPGLPALREIVSQRLREEDMAYDFETEIIITCGAIEGIAATFLALLEPGDQVLIPSPTYASYPQVIKVAGGEPVYFNLNEENGWSFDIPALERAITPKTKAILLSNPNNPTGTIYTEQELLQLAAIAEKHDIYIVLDEVYRDFLYVDVPFFTLASVPALKDRVIRIFSFSKAYAMTGWRVGFLHSSAENVREILKVHDSLVTCAPVISQYAAMAAFDFADASVAEFRNAYRRRRDLLCGRLDQLSDYLTYQKPTSSYFVFPRLLSSVPSAHDSETFCYHLVDHAKVALVPGKAFGPTGEGHIRLSFGRTEADITLACDRLANYLTERRAVVPTPVTAPIMQLPVRRVRSIAKRFVTMIMGRQAQVFLKRTKPHLIAVIGTVNKARTREYIELLLREKYNMRSKSRGYNTDIGLPLAILDLPQPTRTFAAWWKTLWQAERVTWLSREKRDVMVVEFGADAPGEMRRLLWIAKPAVVVVTEIQPSYANTTQYLDTVAKEYEHAVRAVKKDGIVVLNVDDQRVATLKLAAKGTVITIGETGDVQGMYDDKTQQLTITLKGTSETFKYSLTGQSELRALLLAVGVSISRGMTLTEMTRKLTKLT